MAKKVMAFWIKTTLSFFFLLIILSLIFVNSGLSQAPPAEESEFNDLGFIAYANDYKLSPEFDNITFRVKNQSTLTIDKIYAWIYHISEDEEGNPLVLSLVNNPHRGGVITKGNPHRPGDIAEWRFPLFKALTSKKIGRKYTIRLSHKGIFFKKIEPSAKLPQQP